MCWNGEAVGMTARHRRPREQLWLEVSGSACVACESLEYTPEGEVKVNGGARGGGAQPREGRAPPLSFSVRAKDQAAVFEWLHHHASRLRRASALHLGWDAKLAPHEKDRLLLEQRHRR